MIKFKTMLEKFVESRSPSATAAKILLAFVALGGIVIIGAMAPNIFSAFGRFGYKNFSKNQTTKAFYNLKRRKLIETISDKNGIVTVRLTKKGETKVRKFSIDALEIVKPKKWDKKWRLVIFDIPNYLSKARRALSDTFKELGLRQLQKSVWVYPYSCEDEILFVADFFGVEKFVEIVETTQFLNPHTEEKLIKLFELS